MLKHILVAVDGSVNSRRAARFALALAEQTKAKVTLLSVVPPPEALPMAPMGGYVPMSPPVSDAQLAAMKAQLAEISAEHPKVETVRLVEIGPVTDTILKQAEHQQVDLIVLGARGLGAAGRFLLGSVSDRVTHHAHCPVTVWR